MIRAVIFDCTGVLTGMDMVVNRQLLDYIQHELKPKYKIGILSNLSRVLVDRKFLPVDLQLFDYKALASETGIIKPDPRAFHLVAERLEVKPEQCIFVDDYARSCATAREEGMQTVLYTNYEQARREIDSILRQDL